ncbi:MAG: undecaprenyl/decaprenyl-phosphate alpha-N-acetylglucosaminyl 1-phosphate transferase [Sciscionella sp.]|nr:undecaprenyl/decaprenyl-phosphate alpha-N-acetylglucosaminyl 1-phosphate transferase [Sciscionella sp.]
MGSSPDVVGAGLPVPEYLLVALTAAAVTFLLTGVVRVFAFRIGAVAKPRARDVHVVPMPRMGGVAMYCGVVGGMFLAHQLPELRRAFDYSLDPVAVLVGGGAIVLVGILDDRFELDWLTKLAGQVTAAGVLVLFGLQWFLFWVPWGGQNGSIGSLVVLDQNQGGLLAVLLAITMANAMNFVDGLDGLAAGIGAIAAIATCAFSLVMLKDSGGDVNNYPPALIAATLAGACVGFLPHNFQPAKIFMGDSGSMLVGLMLAASTTSASGHVTPSYYGAREALALLTPVLVVAAVLFIPLLDLIMAVIRRASKGMPIGHPDKMHLHHRLLQLGHSQRRAVLLIYLWAGVIAFGAVALSIFDPLVVLWAMAVGLVVALLISATPKLRRLRTGR